MSLLVLTPESARFRRDQSLIVAEAVADIDALLRSTDERVLEALRDVLPALIESYGVSSAAVAADWYDGLRESLGVRGRFAAVPAEIVDVGADSLVGWASSKATDDTALRSLVAGGAQRRILNFGRLTITGSTVEDPRSRGWTRVGVGECEWCTARLDGEVIPSPEFASHDDCNCHAEPTFV